MPKELSEEERFPSNKIWAGAFESLAGKWPERQRVLPAAYQKIIPDYLYGIWRSEETS